MQIENRINGRYGLYFQNNKVMKGTTIENKKSMKEIADREDESYQIGGRAFTMKEWNYFLKKYDAIQDTVREQMKEHQEKLEKQKLDKKMWDEKKWDEQKMDAKERVILESSSYSYPTDNSDGEVVLHVTCYTEKGKYFRNAGKIEKYEWAIPFADIDEKAVNQ